MEANKYLSWTLSSGTAYPKPSNTAHPPWSLSRGGACLKMALQSNPLATLSPDLPQKENINKNVPSTSTLTNTYIKEASATTNLNQIHSSSVQSSTNDYVHNNVPGPSTVKKTYNKQASAITNLNQIYPSAVQSSANDYVHKNVPGPSTVKKTYNKQASATTNVNQIHPSAVQSSANDYVHNNVPGPSTVKKTYNKQALATINLNQFYPSAVQSSANDYVHKNVPGPSTVKITYNKQALATINLNQMHTSPVPFTEDLDISDVEDPEWAPQIKKKRFYSPQSDSSEISDSSDNNAAELNFIEGARAFAEMMPKKLDKRKLNFEARMQGKKYMGMKKRDGKYTYSVSKEPKHLVPRECQHSCNRNKATRCNEFTEEDRQILFEAYWKMDWNQKKVFVASNVDSHNPTERTSLKGENSRRKRSFVYHLKRNECRVRVCKNMLLSTLGISDWQLLKWTDDSQNGTQTTSVLSKTPTRKRAEHSENRTGVRSFVDSLPKLPSHYCRSSTSRMYLQSDIKSFSHLYNIYTEYCATDEIKCVSMRTFKFVLDEMKVSIFHPKKDQCDVCCSFETGNLQEAQFRQHIQKKVEARNEKEIDKRCALEGSCKVITVDLQAVLLSPSLLASSMYYKTKLACHNYTLYDLGSGEVSCYVWHEGQADLGSNNFASCLTDYIEKITFDGDRVLIIYSDGCTYQNRNCILSNSLLDLSMKNNLTIYQKILEKGHTQMECDSVHSTIEHALRHRSIYVPADYINIMKNVRGSKPYEVNYVDYTFFKDFSQLNHYSSIRPGVKVGDLCVTDLRVLKYNPNGTIQYKTRYTEDYMEFPYVPQTSHTP